MTSPRLDKLKHALSEAGLDALLLNPGPTLTYLTGLHFHLMERPVVLLVAAGQEPALVLPALETPKLDALPYNVRAFPYPEDLQQWSRAFQGAVQALNLDGRKIGVEPGQLRLLEFRQVQAAAPAADYPDASQVIAALRLQKDADEVARMRQAVDVAQTALEATLPSIQAGMSEQELVAELVVQLLRHGSAPELPFSPIVSAGPNGANPHAAPSGRKLQPGDLLVVDWGATVDGYISDLTRTFAIGEPDAESRKIYQIVQQANAAGCAVAQPGVSCAAVDAAARDVIEKAGYGPYFTHRTGHGIGLEAHEGPYIRGDNRQLLTPGMAFTVEPGIYLTGRNGVRIEDNLVITETGAEILSDMPRELRSVG